MSITTYPVVYQLPKCFLRRRRWRLSGSWHISRRSAEVQKYKGLDRYYKRRPTKRRFNLFKYNANVR